MTVEPNDPTRAGSPVAAASNGVVLSLSEIQALCMKAARGAGLPWGLAEEAGMAGAWLAAAGLPGPDLILQLLQEPAHEPPAVAPGRWRPAASGALCPLTAGTALSDFAGLAEGLDGGALTIQGLFLPLLLVPFAAGIARRLNRTVGIAWPGFTALLGPAGYRLSADARNAAVVQRADATVTWADEKASMTPLGRTGRAVPHDVWEELDRLAMRTTVPATARSHADAGAAGSDNE
ncbi:MAG: DUF3726 domain-containing protein [Dongiaceae bacterium]